MGYPKTPDHIRWCLDNPTRVAHRFTPFQWWVLNLAWGWSGDHTNRWVAKQIGVPTEVVRETREVAEGTAIEVVFVLIPAVDRWKHGEATKADRPILAKYRRTKRGRWEGGNRRLLPLGMGYKMKTLPFSELDDPERDEPYEPDSELYLYGPDPNEEQV